MAISDEIKQETNKIKDMSLKGKIGYIWEYYKGWIIGGLIAVIFLSIFIHDWIGSSRPVYLYSVVINSDFVYEDKSTVLADYASKENVDLDKNNLYIDFSMQMTDDMSDQLTMGNQQKIMVLYSSNSLDCVIGPEDIMQNYASIDAFADIETLLSDEQKAMLADKGYEYYYSTTDGRKRAVGIYMDTCTYLNDQGTAGTFPDMNEDGKRPVFTIAINAPHPEHALSFLDMLISE